MAPKVNHRGWMVLCSIASADGLLCVDFFEDPSGGFGFEHLRADPEDGGGWTPVGGFGTSRFATPMVATGEAAAAVSWLGDEAAARRSLDDWRTELEAG